MITTRAQKGMILTISLQHVSKEFTSRKHTVTALKDINLQVEAGAIFGLIGHSGAGKSTLLRCINLLEQPTSGDVIVNQVSLRELPKRQLQKQRKNMGMIFQHFHLLNSVTVAENIAFPLRLAHVPRAKSVRKVQELLELVGLVGHGHKYPAQLSGGQKQRVAIARALANDPQVLLSDEATSALDPQTTQSILDLLIEINRRLGITIVIVTHEMSVVQRVCDHVAVLDRGTVVEQGRVTDVFLDPKHEITRSLLSVERDRPPIDTNFNARGTLLDISFVGELTYLPVLAEVARETSCTFSILKGTVDALKDVPFGRLVVDWIGSDEHTASAVKQIEARGCRVRQISHQS